LYVTYLYSKPIHYSIASDDIPMRAVTHAHKYHLRIWPLSGLQLATAHVLKIQPSCPGPRW